MEPTKFLIDQEQFEEEINIKTKHPEFLEWKWVELDQITDLVVKFKLELYKEVKDKVKKILN